MHAFVPAFLVTLILYICVARWWIAPALARLPAEQAIAPLAAFHGLRTIGMGLMSPGSVDAAVPMAFRQATAYGDLASAVLGIAAAALLMRKSRLGRPMAWVFSIFGIADLLNALVSGARLDVFEYSLGMNWLAVTLYVPALWVTHAMIVHRLVRK